MRILLYLDGFHLDDLLFHQQVGRLLAKARFPMALVHGSAGEAESILESRGLFESRGADGLYPARPDLKPYIETALRQRNRQLVTTLNDNVVPAIGVHGSDRKLLVREDGRIVAVQTAWLAESMEKGVVPVVSTLVQGEEASPADVLAALAPALSAQVVMFTRTGRASLSGADGIDVTRDAVQASIRTELADPAVAQSLLDRGLSLWVTAPTRFLGLEEPAIIRVRP